MNVHRDVWDKAQQGIEVSPHSPFPVPVFVPHSLSHSFQSTSLPPV